MPDSPITTRLSPSSSTTVQILGGSPVGSPVGSPPIDETLPAAPSVSPLALSTGYVALLDIEALQQLQQAEVSRTNLLMRVKQAQHSSHEKLIAALSLIHI